MIAQCGTCRFFGSTVDTWDDDTQEVRPSKHHRCARIIHGNITDPEIDNTSELAVVTDGSGYVARLNVMANFGCVLHEPQDS